MLSTQNAVVLCASSPNYGGMYITSQLNQVAACCTYLLVPHAAHIYIWYHTARGTVHSLLIVHKQFVIMCVRAQAYESVSI